MIKSKGTCRLKCDEHKTGSTTKYLTQVMVLAIFFALNVYGSEKGQQAFKDNCVACHQLNDSLVGPSVKEIRTLYPLTKRQQFLDWTINPGKKRPDSVQMPAMSHLGETVLREIHQYILSEQARVSKSKPRNTFTFTPMPKRYPYYKRGVMPFASPASIGVMFSKQFGINWDASICRLRYAFISDDSFFSGEKDKQKRFNDLVYRETSSELWSFANGKKTIFKGYRLQDDLPEFIYRLGDIVITERVVAVEQQKSFQRVFSLQGITTPVTMDLTHQGKATLTSSKGQWSEGKLTLTAAEAKHFTLTVSIQ